MSSTIITICIIIKYCSNTVKSSLFHKIKITELFKFKSNFKNYSRNKLSTLLICSTIMEVDNNSLVKY